MIVKKLKVKRQKVNYWALHPLKTEQIKKRKLLKKYFQKILAQGKDKTKNAMNSARITKYINLMLERDKMNIKVSNQQFAGY